MVSQSGFHGFDKQIDSLTWRSLGVERMRLEVAKRGAIHRIPSHGQASAIDWAREQMEMRLLGRCFFAETAHAFLELLAERCRSVGIKSHQIP